MPQWNPPEMMIATNHMPKGFGEDSTFQLVLSTESSGTGFACIGPQALDVLCQEAAKAISRILDENGKAVPGVEELRVRVMSQPATDRMTKWLKSL